MLEAVLCQLLLCVMKCICDCHMQYVPRIWHFHTFHCLGMTVGFTQVTNTVIESAEYVEVCVDVLIPGEALRNFTVILIPEEGIKECK